MNYSWYICAVFFLSFALYTLHVSRNTYGEDLFHIFLRD